MNQQRKDRKVDEPPPHVSIDEKNGNLPTMNLLQTLVTCDFILMVD